MVRIRNYLQDKDNLIAIYIHCKNWVSLFSGMERWNGMVEWNGGMEWNSGMM